MTDTGDRTPPAMLPDWADFITPDHFRVTFAPEGRDDTPSHDRDVALTDWMIRNTGRQKPVLLRAVLDRYPEFRHDYFAGYGLPEDEAFLPSVVTEAGLAELMQLRDVNVHPVTKDAIPYVGYGFACRWDDEHGLGVLMHDLRIVALGGADTAILQWIAERDRDG